jgi:hypothetical protein
LQIIEGKILAHKKKLKQFAEKLSISISKGQVQRVPCSAEFANRDKVLLCFKCFTDSKNYSFEHFSKGGANTLAAMKECFNEFVFLSDRTWLELMQLGKEQGGAERFLYTAFRPELFKNLKFTITPDEKLYVFRFGGNKYRLVGHRCTECRRVLHVLGFDFDFTLYNHGS